MWRWFLIVLVGCWSLSFASAAPLELVLQTGHSKSVKSACLSGDGKYLVSGSEDGTAIVWDVATGQMLRRFVGHTGAVNGVSLSADGRRLATGSFDRTINIWNTETGARVRTIKEKVGIVNSVALRADGKQLVSGGWNNEITLWDAETGEAIKTFKGHTSTVNSVEFTPTGTQILSASRDQTALIWDIEKGEVVRTFKGHKQGVSAAHARRDGRQVITTCEDGTAIVWDTVASTQVFTLKSGFGAFYDARFSPDYKRIVTVGYDNKIKMWDAETGKPALPDIQHNEHSGNVVIIDGDGKHFVAGLGSGVLLQYDLAKGTKIRSFSGTGKALRDAGLSTDNKRLALAHDDTATVWDLEKGTLLHTFEKQRSSVVGMAFRSDGTRLAVTYGDYLLVVWDTVKGVKQSSAQLGNMPFQVSFTGDGKEVLVTDAHRVRTINTDNGNGARAMASAGDIISAAAFSPDGQRLIFGTSIAQTYLWDVKENKQLFQMRGHSNSVLNAQFLADGKHAITSAVDGVAIMWDVATGQKVRSFGGERGAARFCIGANNKRLALGAGSQVLLYDIEKGDLLQTFKGHSDSIGGVALSADGRRLLSSSSDGTARLWDIATGKELATLLTANDSKDWAVVTPDGLFDGSPAGIQSLTFREPESLKLVKGDTLKDQRRLGLLTTLWQATK